MKANIKKQASNGWPAQSRPDRKLPEPWTDELLVGVNLIHHHSPSPDGKQIAFVWQREGNSDIYIIKRDIPGWPLRLTFDRPEQTVWTDAKPNWSPDGKWLAYVAKDDIWVVPSAGGKARRITDFELGDSSPIFGPDKKKIYFLSERKDFYNLCWTTLEGEWPTALTRFEADVSDPRPAPDGSSVVFVYHPQVDLLRSEICVVSTINGEVKHMTGLDKVMDTQPRWSPDGKQITFISNRDGWRNLYLLDPINGKTDQLTSEKKDVLSYAWNPTGEQLALVLNHQSTGDLYTLELSSRHLSAIHIADGWHNLPVWSPDGDSITFEYESPTQPPEIFQIDVKSKTTTQLTHSKPPILTTAALVSPEFIEYSSEGHTIPGFIYRPKNASPEQPCPAIVYPHGGPTDEHARYWEMLPQWLAAKGYAVLAPNYRGSTGNGLAHQHALHDNWGVVDTQDMLSAADYLAGLAWVDGQRLGIYGASYGSYLAVLALARDPKYRFKCGVAKFGDCDILSSWAQGDRPGREDLERQMGHPTTNRAGYNAGSPIYEVANIQSPLLIFHGEKDIRVHPKQSEQLVEELTRAGKTFEYIVYEDEGHGFLQKGNVLHFYQTMERFLDYYLL